MAPLEPITRAAPRLAGRVVAAQTWRRAAFVHWRVGPELVAALLPPGTRPDLHDGATWAGLIAFDLGRARVAPFGPVPFAGDFVEVNVRLYAVDDAGRRGVVFRSLEASRVLAVAAARALYGLPYRWARTAHEVEGDLHRYTSRRHLAPGAHRMAVRVDPSRTVDDDAAAFLTARWALFQGRGARTLWMPNRHEPWLLHPAELVELDDELLALAGLPGLTGRAPDSVLFSRGVDAEFGRPVALG
ncbi:YqjF family protein [Pseudolysinimonas sp.]|uniref:YqjF family protein n=1 Tax=Pseudolysinimonas sp. TaxID=2680009 RepID=UPI003F7F1EA8